MFRRSVSNSCCCIWKYCNCCIKIYSCYLAPPAPFFLKNVHNTCYNYTCVCPRMQKCILRGPNYKNLPGGERSCTPTPKSCLWVEIYHHHLLLKLCLLRFFLKTLVLCTTGKRAYNWVEQSGKHKSMFRRFSSVTKRLLRATIVNLD